MLLEKGANRLHMKTPLLIGITAMLFAHTTEAQQSTPQGTTTNSTVVPHASGTTGSGQRSASTTAAGSETGRPTTESATAGKTATNPAQTPSPSPTPLPVPTGNTGNGSQFMTNNRSGVSQPGTGTVGTGVGTER